MIELKNVSKRYKTGTHALSDVSFKIEDGEFVFIMGPSGAGKSTLVKLLDGEEVPTSGKVIVSGVDVGRLKKSKVYLYRRKIGVVFQDFKLLPKKTVFENIAYALEILDMPTEKIRKRVRDVLKLVELSDKSNALPKELSGGQQQRVAIARSVVKRPMIIIADEPTGNLDENLTNEMIELLEKINRDEKTTIIVVTHNINTVENHPKRTIRIENGHVVSDSIYKPQPKKVEVKEEPREVVPDGMLFGGVKSDDEDVEEKANSLEEKVLNNEPAFEFSLEPDHQEEEKQVEIQETETVNEEPVISFEETAQINNEPEIEPIVKDNTPVFDKQEIMETPVEIKEETVIETPLTSSDDSAMFEDDFTEQIDVLKDQTVNNNVEIDEDDFTEQFTPISNRELGDDEFVIEDYTATSPIVFDDSDDILQSALNEMNETIEMFKNNNKE